jgi:hypothetical protein
MFNYYLMFRHSIAILRSNFLKEVRSGQSPRKSEGDCPKDEA